MAASGEPRLAPASASEPAASGHESRLRSVFLQHHLIAGLPPLPGIPAPTAKFVVEQIVERLLTVADGIEPLMALQRDPVVLARATATAVVAVVVARAAGWPGAQLADLGAAALLAEIGAVLGTADTPARLAFAWLLQRGTDDFWLRCALIARHTGAGSGGNARATPPLLAVTIVELARAVVAAAPGSPAPDAVPPELRAAVASVLAGR